MRPLAEPDERALQSVLSDALRPKVAGKGAAEAGAAAWEALRQLEALAYALPTEVGGYDLGDRSALHVCEALGYFAAPVGYADVLQAAECLMDGEAAELRSRVARMIGEGEAIVFLEAEASAGADAIRVIAEETGAGDAGATLTVAGELTIPKLAAETGTLCLACKEGDSVRIYLVENWRGQAGVICQAGRLPCYARISFSPATCLQATVHAEVPASSYARIAARARLRQSMFLLGLAAGAQDVAIARASSRPIFGNKLADMQAVSNRLAAIQSRIEAVRLLIYFGSAQEGEEADRVSLQTLAAASELARDSSQLCMQLHGSSGLETDRLVHRYYMISDVEGRRLGRARQLWMQAGQLYVEGVNLESLS